MHGLIAQTPLVTILALTYLKETGMLFVYRALGVYRIIIIVWAVMSWIPGVAGSALHNIIGLPLVPVLRLFSFARLGFVGFEAIILLLIIWGIEIMIERKLKEQGIDPHGGRHSEDH